MDGAEFSGDLPEELLTHSLEAAANATDEAVLTGDGSITITIASSTDAPFTTEEPFFPYTPAYFRIGWLSVKCILALLILTLSFSIRRRDFLKALVVVLLLPVLFECGFDIYTEVRATMDFSGRVEQKWDFFKGDIMEFKGPLHNLQTQVIPLYGQALTHYTTYQMFSNTWWLALVEYSLASWLFWTSLFSSVVAFQFAHKAITRPEEISYTHFFRGFLSVQLFTVLPLALLDVLLAVFPVHPILVGAVSSLLRFSACTVAFVLICQAFFSLFWFCVRRDEYAKTSPYSQVRHAKCRLFWLIIFQILVQALAAPYMVWASLSLVEDFSGLFNIHLTIPRDLALLSYALHISSYFLRPLVFLLLSLVLLPPYRKKFIRSFCSCCSRN